MEPRTRVVLEVDGGGGVYDRSGTYIGTLSFPLKTFDSIDLVPTSTIEKLVNAGLSAEDIVTLRKGGVI